MNDDLRGRGPGAWVSSRASLEVRRTSLLFERRSRTPSFDTQQWQTGPQKNGGRPRRSFRRFPCRLWRTPASATSIPSARCSHRTSTSIRRASSLTSLGRAGRASRCRCSRRSCSRRSSPRRRSSRCSVPFAATARAAACHVSTAHAVACLAQVVLEERAGADRNW